MKCRRRLTRLMAVRQRVFLAELDESLGPNPSENRFKTGPS
jgi:hypothetical protein